MLRILSVSLAVALGAFACAKNQGTSAPASAGDAMMDSGAAALASKLNINKTYVEVAASTAKSLLAQGSDQPSAISQGVEQASAKATSDGTPLSAEQRGGLMEGLGGLLGGAK